MSEWINRPRPPTPTPGLQGDRRPSSIFGLLGDRRLGRRAARGVQRQAHAENADGACCRTCLRIHMMCPQATVPINDQRQRHVGLACFV